MTPGFETEQERFEVAAKLGWIPNQLMNQATLTLTARGLIKEWDRLTDILLARIEELETELTAATGIVP